MLPMNTSSTTGTAVLRGIYNFIGTSLAAALSTYIATGAVIDSVSRSDKIESAAIIGLISGLAALGFRSGVEGSYDAARQRDGDVKTSDVQPGVAGEA